MRLLCDAMLGHLARDLRALGHDTVLATDEPDEELVARAEAEARVLVTCDQGLQRHGVVLDATDRAAQLAQLARRIDLGPSTFLSRCIACNVSLVPDEGDEAPADADGPFTRCPSCHRLYWHGSHVEAMRRRLAAYL